MKKGEKWYSLCMVCGKPVIHRIFTCSEECYEKLIDKLVKEFGEFKKVIDAVTGKAYRVPTRSILENGLKQRDLWNYPLWKKEKEK